MLFSFYKMSTLYLITLRSIIYKPLICSLGRWVAGHIVKIFILTPTSTIANQVLNLVIWGRTILFPPFQVDSRVDPPDFSCFASVSFNYIFLWVNTQVSSEVYICSLTYLHHFYSSSKSYPYHLWPSI